MEVTSCSMFWRRGRDACERKWARSNLRSWDEYMYLQSDPREMLWVKERWDSIYCLKMGWDFICKEKLWWKSSGREWVLAWGTVHRRRKAKMNEEPRRRGSSRAADIWNMSRLLDFKKISGRHTLSVFSMILNTCMITDQSLERVLFAAHLL